MQLPALVVQALAHALDYVRPLHMEAVLRYGASFKPFHDAHQMSLSPNALRYACVPCHVDAHVSQMPLAKEEHLNQAFNRLYVLCL